LNRLARITKMRKNLAVYSPYTFSSVALKMARRMRAFET
jgi:hypothetical protein